MAVEQIHTATNVRLTFFVKRVTCVEYHTSFFNKLLVFLFQSSESYVQLYHFCSFLSAAISLLCISQLPARSVVALHPPQRKEIKLLFFIKKYKVIFPRVRFFRRFSVEQLLAGGPIIRYKPRSISYTLDT